jgi:hypothetical protein
MKPAIYDLVTFVPFLLNRIKKEHDRQGGCNVNCNGANRKEHNQEKDLANRKQYKPPICQTKPKQ